MKRKKCRALAFVLSAVLLLSGVPAAGAAAQETSAAAETQQESDPAGEAGKEAASGAETGTQGQPGAETKAETETEAETATETESETETYDPSRENRVETELADGGHVEAVIPADAFDQEVSLEARVLSLDDREGYQALEAVSALIAPQDSSLIGGYAVDISFTGADGETLQPAEGKKIQVSVAVNSEDMGLAAGDDAEQTDGNIYHISDGKAEPVKDGRLSFDGGNRLIGMEFSAGSFSPFVATVEAGLMTN
ncbi:MAG: hypothetical protein Q4C65_14685, partial [Eubacteriales bacterium]|nr:hypothetical protein [Eubacteriales bacterium]